MYKHSVYLFLLGCLIALPGCVTQKSLTYFNNVDSTFVSPMSQARNALADPEFKVGDAFFVSVSAVDVDAVMPFNLPAMVYTPTMNKEVTTTPARQSYTVAPDGSIDFPVLGNIAVAGMRRSELKAVLEQRISKMVNNPIVIITPVDVYVTVMGEVAHPGRVSLPNGRLTLLEALAGAGDLTPYGKRDNVMVMREVEGKALYTRVDLNSSEVVNSPYFFLQQNDVIYVSPNRVRAISSQNVSLWLSMVSTVASAATVIVTVVNAAKR